MIHELYISVVSRFGIKVITKNMAVLALYRIRHISSFKSEKGDTAKLSRTGFI